MGSLGQRLRSGGICVIQHFLFSSLKDGQVNLPIETYLKDVTVYDYGGTITGLETFNISRGGAVKVYPPSRDNPFYKDIEYNLDTISVLDGGEFSYFGSAVEDDTLRVTLGGDLIVRGGGVMTVNNMELHGKSKFRNYFKKKLFLYTL